MTRHDTPQKLYRNSNARLGRLVLPATGALALVFAAGGCARTSADEALLKAKIQATTPSAEGSGDAFEVSSKRMVELLSPHADSVESAAVVLSLAELGVATADASELRSNEAKAFADIRLAQVARERWMDLNAQRLAAESISVEEEVSEIDATIAGLEDERVGVDADREEIEGELAALDEQIEGLRTRASEQRQHAGEIELTLNSVPAQEAVRAAEQIREHTLEADRYEIEATRLQQSRDRVHSRVLEARLKSTEIAERVALLGQNRADAIARRDAARRDAREATELASAARRELIDALDTARASSETATQKSEQIVRTVRTSTQRATSTQGAPQSTASLTAVAGNQMLGYLWWRRSASLERLSELELTIGEALDDAGIVAAGETTQSGAQDAFSNATQAYSSAASSARRVRPQDPNTRDELSAIADRFQRFAETEFGELPDLTVPAVNADEDDFGGGFDDEFEDSESMDDETDAGDDSTMDEESTEDFGDEGDDAP